MVQKIHNQENEFEAKDSNYKVYKNRAKASGVNSHKALVIKVCKWAHQFWIYFGE